MGKMNQITHCDWLPEQARWSHLARLGLLAECKKNFLESHINDKSFIDQVCSVMMAGYWPCSFLRVYGPRREKKNLANIQPSLPHTWSVKHIYFTQWTILLFYLLRKLKKELSTLSLFLIGIFCILLGQIHGHWVWLQGRSCWRSYH